MPCVENVTLTTALDRLNVATVTSGHNFKAKTPTESSVGVLVNDTFDKMDQLKSAAPAECHFLLQTLSLYQFCPT